MHFPASVAKGEQAVEAHLDFFEKTDTDIIKIMNENLVPVVSGIKEPEDFDKIPAVSMNDEFMKHQVELTKKNFGEKRSNCIFFRNTSWNCSVFSTPI